MFRLMQLHIKNKVDKGNINLDNKEMLNSVGYCGLVCMFCNGCNSCRGIFRLIVSCPSKELERLICVISGSAREYED